MQLRGLARHEVPEIDAAALAMARDVDDLLDAARARAAARWESYLTPFPDLLRDAPPADLRGIARRLRAAYGPKDSIVDVLPWETCQRLRDRIDALQRLLARAEVAR
jgi:hypothetical protein